MGELFKTFLQGKGVDYSDFLKKDAKKQVKFCSEYLQGSGSKNKTVSEVSEVDVLRVAIDQIKLPNANYPNTIFII